MLQYPDLVKDFDAIQETTEDQELGAENTFTLADVTSLYQEVIKVSNISSTHWLLLGRYRPIKIAKPVQIKYREISSLSIFSHVFGSLYSWNMLKQCCDNM